MTEADEKPSGGCMNFKCCDCGESLKIADLSVHRYDDEWLGGKQEDMDILIEPHNCKKDWRERFEPGGDFFPDEKES